jgi:glycosyltransferase involved in cell wall biosynthesis
MKTFVVPTAEYLHEKCGYDITLICNDNKAFKESLPDYIHFIPVNMARGIDASGFKSLLSFIKIFKQEKFDMVQYSTPNAACYASIAAKICSVPIRLYCQWGIRYVGLTGISRKVFKAIEKMVCSNSTDIRAVSPMNKDFAVSEGLYPTGKAIVVGNGGTIGVDTKIFDIDKKQEWKDEIRKQYEIAADDYVFGFSGRITVDKGCRELLAAFKGLKEKGSKSKLFIVGQMDANCGISPELISWARTSKSVVLTGMIDGSQMCKFYSAMDVLVHPTYREGFGMVIQEAGALGIPVITTKVQGASEVMEEGISAVHIEAKNVNELSEAMLELCNDIKKTRVLGERALQRTMQLYNRAVMLEHQRVDYEQLIGC